MALEQQLVAPTSLLRSPPEISWLAVSLMMLSALTTTWGAIPAPVGDVFLVLCLCVVVAEMMFAGLSFIVPGWLWVPVIALMMCLVVRFFIPPPYYLYILRFQASPFKPENFVKGGYWLVALVAVPLAIIACTQLVRSAPRLIMGAYLAGVCGSSIVALSDLMGLTKFSARLGYESINARQIGLTTHPNTLGFTCAIAMPLALYFMGTMRHRWIPAIAIALLAGGVIASGSRGSQVALPIAAVFALLAIPNKRTVAKYLAITVAIAGVVSVVMLSTLASHILTDLFRFSDTSNGASASQSDEHRSLLAIQALSDFSRYPFFGLGIRHIVEAHDIYLQLLAGGGLVLMIGFLIYWVLILRDSWQLHKAGELLSLPLMLSISTWLVLGFIENQLTDRLLYYTIGCVAGLVSLHTREQREGKNQLESDGVARVES
jgi:hypothetical protein